MTSIDYAADIDRIIAILKSNQTLDKEMRAIKFGESNYLKYDEHDKYILVTVPNRPFLTRDQLGSGDDTFDSQDTVQYLIKIIVQSYNTENAERELYKYIKEVTDILKSNRRGKNPISNDDPRWIRSFVFDVPLEPSKRGQVRLIATVGIQCQIGSQFTLDISEFSAIPLISKPIEREIEITENIYSTARVRKNISPISETHSFFAEIPYDETIISNLRTQKRNHALLTFTLNRPDSSTSYDGKITEISNGSQFDQPETATIRLEVIH